MSLNLMVDHEPTVRFHFMGEYTSESAFFEAAVVFHFHNILLRNRSLLAVNCRVATVLGT
jgi:hypothetical protein